MIFLCFKSSAKRVPYSRQTKYQEVIASYQKDMECVSLKKTRCHSQIKLSIQLFWRHSQVCCVSHYLLPFMWTAQGMTALTTYYLPISASVDHLLTVIPALSQPKHKTLLSYVPMFLHNLGYLSQILHSDSTWRDIYQRQKSLPIIDMCQRRGLDVMLPSIQAGKWRG